MRRGITMIEVLIVIFICLVVSGLGILFLARQREAGHRAQCQNNLRLLGNAFHAFHTHSSADEKARMLPPSRIAPGYATWAVLLAPHLSGQSPLAQWDTERSYFAQADGPRQARLITFFCPARTRADTLSQAGDVDAAGTLFAGGLGDYASVAGDGSPHHDWSGPDANGPLIEADVLERQDDRIMRWKSRTALTSMTRGTAFTFLVGEKHVPVDHMGDASFGDGSLYNGRNPGSFSRIAGFGFPIASTIDAPYNKNFGSYHNAICQFLMGDTSVRQMSIRTDEEILARMSRRGD